jgi:hypothetical protein
MVAPVIAGGNKKKITKKQKGGEPVPYNSLEGGKNKKKVTKKTKGRKQKGGEGENTSVMNSSPEINSPPEMDSPPTNPTIGGKKRKVRKQKGGEGENTTVVESPPVDIPVNTPVNTTVNTTLDTPPTVGGKGRKKRGGTGLMNTIFGEKKVKHQFNPNKPVIGNKLRTGPHKGKYIIKHNQKVYVCEHKK